MNISFKKTKTNKVYQDFVENPSDRKKRRIFSKEFNESIADEAVKVHKRLRAYPTAGDYNKEYGQTLNAIELKKGEKITLVGFGTFEVSERAAREGRNPLTGETIKIAASKSPKFKAGKALKDEVNR